jgi:hypothetical protein
MEQAVPPGEPWDKPESVELRFFHRRRREVEELGQRRHAAILTSCPIASRAPLLL